jgi:hypothetical protein
MLVSNFDIRIWSFPSVSGRHSQSARVLRLPLEMLIRENGATLGLLPERLSNAATALVESLKINVISEEVRRKRPVVVKRRTSTSEQITEMANLYFSWCGLPIRFWSKIGDWRRWEIESFNMLNGDRFRAHASGERCVIEDKLAGESLWEHMNRRTLTKGMLAAAAQELHRAHQFWSDDFAGRWSHGDATTTNVIYDSKTDRARLIDFEIIHETRLPARARHADDLLVLLLDMAGIVSSRQWLPFALEFLRAYNDPKVIRELKKQLILPGGLAWIWWEVRTNFAAPAKIKWRLGRLREAIDKLEAYRLAPAVPARKSRFPSITCQVMRPGMPIARSRNRAISEIANAVSPGMPSKLPITR